MNPQAVNPCVDTREKLLPCPFCDAAMEVSRQFVGHPQGDCVLSQFGLPAERIAAWNTRTTGSHDGDVVEAVARLIETARDYERGLHLERRLGATWDELEQAKRELFAALSRARNGGQP